jgi:hypothetical protein
VLRHHLRWPTTTTNRADRGGSGALCSDTTTSQGQGSYTSWPPYLNPWTSTVQMWPGFGGVNVQQPSPPAMLADAFPYGLPPQQVGLTFALPVAPPPPAAWTPWMSSRHQQPLAHSFHTMTMVPPTVTDSGASNHTTFNVGNLTSIRPPLPTDTSSIVVGNGSSLPVTSVCNTTLTGPFYLNNVLVTPDIIQNILSIHRFTTNN